MIRLSEPMTDQNVDQKYPAIEFQKRKERNDNKIEYNRETPWQLTSLTKIEAKAKITTK